MNKSDKEKIQKVLATSGIGSRRKVEQWIREARICVNGQLAHIGMKIDLSDKVTFDGKNINLINQDEVATRVILYYKPEGQVCTRRDEQNRETIFKSLPKINPGRWINIGRLDINTSGLLLLTNNGELANQLMHPKSDIEREYCVRIFGHVTDEILSRLLKGVKLEDGFAKFHHIVIKGEGKSNQWYQVIIKEGRKREVRRLFESQGLKVSRLIRIRFGSISLPRTCRPGEYLELTKREIQSLKNG